jgi:glycosyltransferase involved in cell wall biosynthesis
MARKLFINGRFLTQELTGVQKYAAEVTKQLLIAFPEATVLAPNHIIQKEMAQEMKAQTLGSLKGHMWEQLDLPRAVKKENGFLINLANSAPLSLPEQMVTLHDAAFKVNPKWFSKKFAVSYGLLIPKLLKSARLVLTVSQSSSSDIQRLFGVEASRILVVRNGVCGEIAAHKPGKTNRNAEFILTVSSINPRKNLVRLVEAVEKMTHPAELWITGAGHEAFASEGMETKFKESPRVKYLGYVNDRELIKLYSNARFMVYPSLYEGFGLPILEAMHMGCPVAASDIPVFKELFEGAIATFPPTDIDRMAQVMDEIWENAAERKRLSIAGIERAAKYRYDDEVSPLIASLKEILA